MGMATALKPARSGVTTPDRRKQWTLRLAHSISKNSVGLTPELTEVAPVHQALLFGGEVVRVGLQAVVQAECVDLKDTSPQIHSVCGQEWLCESGFHLWFRQAFIEQRELAMVNLRPSAGRKQQAQRSGRALGGCLDQSAHC